MASESETVREAVTARLLTIAEMSGIECLSELRGDFTNLIARVISGAVGIVVIVILEEPDPELTQSIRGRWELEFTIRVLENVVTNAAGLVHCMELAERIYAALVYWHPAVAGAEHLIPFGKIERLFIPTGPGKPPDEKFDGRDLHFKCRLALAPHVAA